MSFTTRLVRSQVCCVEELGLCVNSVLQYKQYSPGCLWTSFHLQWEQLLRVDSRLMVKRRDKERETAGHRHPIQAARRPHLALGVEVGDRRSKGS